MAALSIDVTQSLNSKSIAADSTFTFSGTPAADTWFALTLTNSDTNDHVITIPSSYSMSKQATITTFTLPASSTAYLVWRYTGSLYRLFGDPAPIFDSPSSIASATTTNLGSTSSVNVTITGTTTITSFGTVTAGTYRQGTFSGALTLTYNATSLILPGGATITTAAGDSFGAISLGLGNWQVLWYQRAAISNTRSDLQGTGLESTDVGFRGIPINSQSADYTCVAADSGKMIYHPTTDSVARTWTIPANASVAYPIGTTLTFENDVGAGTVTIAITSDTMVLVGSAGTTGNRTLAAGGRATAIKVTSTRWRISGTAELT
jgi:hypothetical protein